MSTTTTFRGLVSGVLEHVSSVLEASRDSLGLRAVHIGEEYRGWETPAAFLWLRPEGVQVAQESGRKGMREYRIPIRVSVLTTTLERSDDLRLIQLLEGTLDLLQRNLPVGTRNVVVVSPARIVPQLADSQGRYDTAGVADVDYFRAYEHAWP